MLEEWEGRVDRLEAALAVTTKARGNVTLHPATIESYLRDLRGTLGRDTDHAGMFLQRLVGKITLRCKANRLVAEIGGNLPGPLDLEDYGKSGAGGVFLFHRPSIVSESATSRHRTYARSARRNQLTAPTPGWNLDVDMP